MCVGGNGNGNGNENDNGISRGPPQKAQQWNQDEMPKRPEDLQTAPFDCRFPNMNLTKYCFTMYCDYHKCVRLKGADYDPCNYFKRTFTSLCPHGWVDKWDQQREEGTFAAPHRI